MYISLAGSQTRFKGGVGLCQGYYLSLFVIFMDTISRRSQGEESVQFGDLRIASMLFADDVVQLASSDQDLQHALGWFTDEWEAVAMIVNGSKSEAMVLCQKMVNCYLRGGSEL